MATRPLPFEFTQIAFFEPVISIIFSESFLFHGPSARLPELKISSWFFWKNLKNFEEFLLNS